MTKEYENVTYNEIGRVELRSDPTFGKRWYCHWDGDMQGEEHVEPLTLDLKQHPPGTKVTIEYPCCPRCDLEREFCVADNECDFDWATWDEHNYG